MPGSASDAPAVSEETAVKKSKKGKKAKKKAAPSKTEEMRKLAYAMQGIRMPVAGEEEEDEAAAAAKKAHKFCQFAL